MRYPALVTKEGRHTLAEFPDCPGCQTVVGPGEDIASAAAEALEGWLESMLEAKDDIRAPSRRMRARGGAAVLWVPVPARLASMLQIRWARLNANLTQAELARRAGVSQQQIAKLEHPDSNPTIATLEKVAAALELRLSFEFEPVGEIRAAAGVSARRGKRK